MAKGHSVPLCQGCGQHNKLLSWRHYWLATYPAHAQLSACYAGLEVSQACVIVRGLAQKAAFYQRKIDKAMPKLGAARMLLFYRTAGGRVEGCGASTPMLGSIR